MENKCCEHYNGKKDITNSCIFCKTYIPRNIDKILAEFEDKLSGIFYSKPVNGAKCTENKQIVRAFLTSKIHQAIAEERERVREKVVVYVSRSSDHGDLSHEARLKLNAEECEIYLADTADGVWGDDWNDAPDDCNSGTPYKETMKGFIKMKVKLGQPLLPLSLTPPTDKPLPDRE